MNFRVTDNCTEKDTAEIHAKLREYNIAHREPAASLPLGIFTEDENGEKLAGLTGEIFGNWLCIKYLFVSEELRGQGIGKKLMKAAEDEARKHGCKSVFVDTFSFQAPGFYEKLGFREVFTLRGIPYTESRHYYTKEIVPDENSSKR